MTAIKSPSILLLLAGGMVLPNGCSSREESKKENIPNVIFFLANDQRHDALGCYGHPIIQSPNLDALAAKGTRFTNNFVTTSICMASRATIMTGMLARTNGVNYYQTPLDSVFVGYTYPVIMKNAGISTGFIGKIGFQVNGSNHAESWFDYYKSVSSDPYFQKMEDGTERHETEIAGDYAIEFLKMQSPEKPFCLSVSFGAAHAVDNDRRPGFGHFPWPENVDDHLYEDLQIPEPGLNDPAIFENMPGFLKNSLNRVRYFWRWDTPEKYQTNMKAYFRMITGLDLTIGRVLAELDKLGLAENTIIIYTADNGYYMGNRGFAGKWSHFEESLKVPLIIYDPGAEKTSQGKVCDEITLNVDIPSTILDYLGIQPPEEYQGESLVPLVKNEGIAVWRENFFCEFTYFDPIIPQWEGIHTKDYVYANYLDHDYEFLHDLKEDPHQLQNFVRNPEYEEILNELRSLCKEKAEYYEEKALQIAEK